MEKCCNNGNCKDCDKGSVNTGSSEILTVEQAIECYGNLIKSEYLTDPTKKLIEKYKSENKIIKIDQEARAKEIKSINEDMEKFRYKDF